MPVNVVSTISGLCKRCYSCIRNCPAKAIKVEDGQAMVVPELCIGCGHCVVVCSQNAKKIVSGIEQAGEGRQRLGFGRLSGPFLCRPLSSAGPGAGDQRREKAGLCPGLGSGFRRPAGQRGI